MTTDTVCERLGHDETVFWVEDDVTAYLCDRCGAEWWETDDD